MARRRAPPSLAPPPFYNGFHRASSLPWRCGTALGSSSPDGHPAQTLSSHSARIFGTPSSHGVPFVFSDSLNCH